MNIHLYGSLFEGKSDEIVKHIEILIFKICFCYYLFSRCLHEKKRDEAISLRIYRWVTAAIFFGIYRVQCSISSVAVQSWPESLR